MLSLRKTRPAPGAELMRHIIDPAIPPAGEVEIAVHATGICGSDLHAFHWDAGYEFMAGNLPVTIGHEFSGVVTALGPDVHEPGIGSRIVCWPTLPCGTCAACMADRASACGARSIVGLHRDGGFAPRVRVPAASCFRIPDSLPLDRAALTEPLSVAVNAVDLAEVEPGHRVAVLGPGPIGLAVAWVAKARGADVLLVGLDDEARLALARRMHIPHTADLDREELAKAAMRAFGALADRVIEATGHPGSIEQGLGILRPEGIFVAAGIHGKDCRLNLARFVREKKQLRGAHDTTRHAFEEAINLLDAQGDELIQLVTHRLPLSDAMKGFSLASGGDAMKVLLFPEKNPDERETERPLHVHGDTA
ncbi:zinc-dependent alcohol dehydrogenase [Paracoccus alkanivorans]|uniref:Sorbitol dehydrogenase n=1 Tax=Paracoccus alkanivorans TaxID=2116655 RepID=A0A3M0MD02_9RHOB|nr:alcohol dehydrogenase catalytic domain-containing protein [Paracoccus alkanivorans]RMC35632.1 sorbitol dehydrogenase [Paracoccus alkanivorans]